LKRSLPSPTKTKAAPILLISALLVALLVFSATAAAETRTGESTSVYSLGVNAPESTIVKGAVSYDLTGGNAVFNVTTAAEPQAENELGEPSTGVMIAGLFTSSGECTPGIAALEALLYAPSALFILSPSPGSTPEAFYGSYLSLGTSPSLPVTKSVAGTTTTISVSSGTISGQGFNCAVITSESSGYSIVAFPITAPPVPPAPPAPEPTPTPAPAPPVLSFPKPKPLKVSAGTWKTVHVKVKNTGATAMAQGSLRVKGAKGVLVKPEVQKLPGLAPGATFTLSDRVKLTEKAKAKTKLAVTATAPGLTGTSSIVLKLQN
jgi:hypothetical protein